MVCVRDGRPWNELGMLVSDSAPMEKTGDVRIEPPLGAVEETELGREILGIHRRLARVNFPARIVIPRARMTWRRRARLAEA